MPRSHAFHKFKVKILPNLLNQGSLKLYIFYVTKKYGYLFKSKSLRLCTGWGFLLKKNSIKIHVQFENVKISSNYFR